MISLYIRIDIMKCVITYNIIFECRTRFGSLLKARHTILDTNLEKRRFCHLSGMTGPDLG